MSIIAPIDFKGERAIPQLEEKHNRDNVQWFIDKYEPKFLKELLGATLYSEFVAGLQADPIDPKWIELRDQTDLKTMLIDYVYYWYLRNWATITAGVGEVKGKSDNATQVSPAQKMVTSWNEMATLARFFDLDTTTYPSWNRVYWRSWHVGCRWHLPEIYRDINTMNI